MLAQGIHPFESLLIAFATLDGVGRGDDGHRQNPHLTGNLGDHG